MAVSKAIVPLLRGELADSFLRTLESSHIRPYTQEEREETDRVVAKILKERKAKRELERGTVR